MKNVLWFILSPIIRSAVGETVKKLLVLFLFIVLAKNCGAETFADIYKPLSLSYLYNLVDSHLEKRVS